MQFKAIYQSGYKQCCLFFISVAVIVMYCTNGLIQHLFHFSSKHSFMDGNSSCTGYGHSSVTDSEACKKRFPNVLIIGVPKAGTTALLTFLSEHPQIVRNNEIQNYFFFNANYDKGFQWYLDSMPYSLPGQVVIEKSASYFVCKETPERIYRFKPDMKFILSVRNPVQRAISNYAMAKDLYETKNKTSSYAPVKFGEPFPPFEQVWKRFLRKSTYDTSLENWLKYFSIKQIHISDGDNFSKTPLQELLKIEKFLNLDKYFDEKQFYFNSTKGFYCLTNPRFKMNGNCLSETKGRKHPNVNAGLIQKLKDIFRPHNERFFRLCGKRFEWE